MFQLQVTLLVILPLLRSDPIDALNAHRFVREPWISVWNASNCCKMISLNNDIRITFNAFILGQDRIYPNTHLYRTFLLGIYHFILKITLINNICVFFLILTLQSRAQYYNALLKLSRPYLKLGKIDSQKQAINKFVRPFVLFVFFVLFVMSICSFGCFPFCLWF